ncbi:PorP/SprF family type IX secretion system membrane protein [Pontibacter cellulosilyticus]|uniref:PorP/SprF family type IX secretion system membrane protein n=1 Tax=Pontibacter cellulosilyticus TaxID=1720253 RepID=A0A923SKY4_9BACT|nr:PorP/SprF family type IX secretion system membrane protein [Pontibacter cellulosilyticus]MBC5994271.1 PorP/SprF family type IX secretion system membrane protein [Pontibacter cellulosilyticus]
MQRTILVTCCLLMLAFCSTAQSRKQLANFSQFQHYYNPSLTGFEGAGVKTLYRNQWTGFEDAPKTILATAELDVKSFGKDKGYNFGNQDNGDYFKSISAKHAVGLSVLHDRFGPSKETQLFLSYGSGVRLSEKLSMRWGTALTYHSQQLDGNSLTVDQENDPRYANLLGQNNHIGKVDLNLGLSLSAANFYVGYAMQDITKGKLVTTGDDFLQDFYTQKHIAQAGYRTHLIGMLGLTVNGIYQYDKNYAGTIEGQLKAVYNNMFWVGGGYRNDKAYHLTGGIRLNQLSIHYAYESPVKEARYINKATNEIALSYNLRKLNNIDTRKQILLW